MEPKGITLKKYSCDNLTDYDIEYKRIDDETKMKFHLDVIFNGKKLGEIHANQRSGMNSVAFEFKGDHFPVTWSSTGNLPDLKQAIVNQILGVAKFIMKFYENR